MIKDTNAQIDADIHNARFRARQSWRNMIYRCNNSNNKYYKDYGGRGIFVCNEWLKFNNFYRDMGGRSIGLTLERRDNNNGYFHDNCKWATQKEQRNNRRTPRTPRNQKFFLALGPEGQIKASKNRTKFANKWGLNSCNISSCLHHRHKYKSHRGWMFDLLIPQRNI